MMEVMKPWASTSLHIGSPVSKSTRLDKITPSKPLHASSTEDDQGWRATGHTGSAAHRGVVGALQAVVVDGLKCFH